MLTLQHRAGLPVDYQATATVRWHVGQHPFVGPDGPALGPVVTLSDATIEPGGVLRARVARGTEELLYTVSGEIAPVRDFHAGSPLTAGTAVATIDGRHRAHYKLHNRATGRTARVVRAQWHPYRPGLAASASCASAGTATLVPVVVPLTEPGLPPTAVGAHQEVWCWAGALDVPQDVPLALDESLYLIVLAGELCIDGQRAADGDGACVARQRLATLEPVGPCRLLMLTAPASYAGEFRWGDARYRTAP
jgi:hypothetical protein